MKRISGKPGKVIKFLCIIHICVRPWVIENIYFWGNVRGKNSLYHSKPWSVTKISTIFFRSPAALKAMVLEPLIIFWEFFLHKYVYVQVSSIPLTFLWKNTYNFPPAYKPPMVFIFCHKIYPGLVSRRIP